MVVVSRVGSFVVEILNFGCYVYFGFWDLSGGGGVVVGRVEVRWIFYRVRYKYMFVNGDFVVCGRFS